MAGRGLLRGLTALGERMLLHGSLHPECFRGHSASSYPQEHSLPLLVSPTFCVIKITNKQTNKDKKKNNPPPRTKSKAELKIFMQASLCNALEERARSQGGARILSNKSLN